jgi:hypothetical protein
LQSRLIGDIQEPPNTQERREERLVHKNFTPQVETCEISDSELDGISGGLASVGVDAGPASVFVSIGDVAGALTSAATSLPVSQLTGLTAVDSSASV